MKRLIITADDFGMSKSVNEAIITCVKAGVVCSTNVMVNMEYAYEATQLRKNYPKLSIGLHYNFTVGMPILPKEKVPTLVDENGIFHSYKEFRKLYHIGRIKNGEIIAEMKAQYERFVLLCGEPDYWNTHENVHVAFVLYHVFTGTSKSFGIYKMRSHQRIYLPSSTKNSMPFKWYVLNPIKTFIINRWQNKSKSDGVKSPEGLIVRLNDNDKLDIEYLCKHIKWNDKRIAELTIHPATDNDCIHFGDITEKRIKEYQAFSDEELISIAKENGVFICGFEEVG